MRALEDLVNSVRDDSAREQLAEAVRAYQAGALRSAIISTWVAVALDLVSKIRELADLGEPGAQAFVAELDSAIAMNDVRTLGVLERGLLDKARDDFELIVGREHTELVRLLEDRHVCAHPAFVDPERVFAPTAELCRSHMSTAVDAVLRHGPSPGRKAIERFVAETKGTAWPATLPELAGHLRAAYIGRGKEVLRRNLALLVVKGCLDPPDRDEQIWRRLSKTAHALDSIAPSLLELALREVVAKREQTTGLPEAQLLRLVGALGDLAPVWHALPATSVPRVVAAVSTADIDELIRLHAFGSVVSQPDVEDAISNRLAALDHDLLVRAVATQPSARLVPRAVALLQSAGGWRTGEARMRDLILPLASVLDIEGLKGVHEALRINSQVREASGVPPMLTALFAQTADLPGALPEWRALSDWLQTQGRGGDPNDWYAYPDLAREVAAMSSTP